MKIDVKMATQQENKHQKLAIKHIFFSKKAKDFELLKQDPESSHQTSSFSRNQHMGH